MLFNLYLVPIRLRKDYNELSIEFTRILGSFADQAFENRIFRRKTLKKKIKKIMRNHWRSSKEEIAALKDESDLTNFLQKYCSFLEFDVLKGLAEDMNMTGITEKLIQFEEKRTKLYSDIVAKDFAKSAIEYCGTTGSRKVCPIFVAIVMLMFKT